MGSADSGFDGRGWTVLTNPAFIARRALARSIRALAEGLALDGTGVWLDVGCGSRPYESFFKVGRYIGMDVAESGHPAESKKYDLLYDGVTFPLETASIDGILCSQALEHMPDPQAAIAEMARVLKPGAPLILTAPFVWQEHEQPYDFLRFTSFGLTRLLESKGFKIEAYRKTTGTVETVAQLFSSWAASSLTLRIKGWSRLIALFVCAPAQIAGLLAQRFSSDRDLFLDSAVLARKI
jgi:ubiquinone/menaquinone biosynthesis C-methylase UbiE